MTDLVADALRSHLPASIPVVLSHLDKRANLRSHARRPAPAPSDSYTDKEEGLNGGKGKAPARAAEAVAAADQEETRPLADASAPSRTSGEAPPDNSRDDDDEAAATRSEPLGFDLEPTVPEPPTTVPRSSARYDLPPGVDSVDDCALVWIGGESLALNNVLLTHGRCRVSIFGLLPQFSLSLHREWFSGRTHADLLFSPAPLSHGVLRSSCRCGRMIRLPGLRDSRAVGRTAC